MARRGTVIKINPVQSSTNGYCHDIFVLHSEHRPRRPIKLTAGTSSHQCNFFLQTTQNDLPPIESPEFHLNPNTFKKLPTTNPRINRDIVITYLLYQIPTNPIGLSYGVKVNHSNNSFLCSSGLRK